MLYKMDPMIEVLVDTDAVRIVSRLGGYGAGSEKPLEIYLTYPLAAARHHLFRSVKQFRLCMAARRAMKIKDVPLTTVSFKKVKGSDEKKVSVNGARAALDLSKQYPVEFCISVARLVVSRLVV